MRSLAVVLVFTTLFVVTACSDDKKDSEEEVSAVSSSSPAAAYDDDAVWTALAPGSSSTPPDLNLTHSVQQCGGPPAGTACVDRLMQSSGATRAAIEFFDKTGWFLTGLRELGPVDLGTIVSPWRANANVQYVMLNGNPGILYAEDAGAKVDFKAEPAYQPLVDAVTSSGTTSPNQQVNVIMFPADNAFEDAISIEQGGQRLVFQYNVVNGCHVCGTGYRERVGFDFDTTGQYRATTVLGLCRGNGAQFDVAGVADCPPTQP